MIVGWILVALGFILNFTNKKKVLKDIKDKD
jgi:hypothetical protein